MQEHEPLSVAVITHNEQRNVERCLRSVAWAAERLVVDCGSTDRTVAIARSCGARVIETDWPGFVAQRNRAIAATTHRWVLLLDADEWLTDAGADEIRRRLAAPAADGYSFNRRTAFSGAFLRGGWSPDWQLRLFRKDRGRVAGGAVHESVRLDAGAVTARMHERLPHLSYRSISDYVARVNRYTDLATADAPVGNSSADRVRLVFSPVARFLKVYLLKGGFRDGTRGWIVAWGSAFTVLLKYAKRIEQGRATDPGFRRVVPPTREDPEPWRRDVTGQAPGDQE